MIFKIVYGLCGETMIEAEIEADSSRDALIVAEQLAKDVYDENAQHNSGRTIEAIIDEDYLMPKQAREVYESEREDNIIFSLK